MPDTLKGKKRFDKAVDIIGKNRPVDTLPHHSHGKAVFFGDQGRMVKVQLRGSGHKDIELPIHIFFQVFPAGLYLKNQGPPGFRRDKSRMKPGKGFKNRVLHRALAAIDPGADTEEIPIKCHPVSPGKVQGDPGPPPLGINQVARPGCHKLCPLFQCRFKEKGVKPTDIPGPFSGQGSPENRNHRVSPGNL